MLVGGLIGLILGGLAAILWDPVAARLATALLTDARTTIRG